MNPQDPLAGLKPLREPVPIDWWPPAPGWWLLLLIVLIAAGVALVWLYRRRQRTAYRRHALQALDRLRAEHAQSGDDARFFTASNALLKRVALLAYPNRALAAVHGQPWLDFLNSSSAGQAPFPETFATAPYTNEGAAGDVDRVYRCAQSWIRHHEGTP